jgi:hypothetical protein
MPDVQQWGRVWTRHNCRVRRGAWYPLLRLTPEAAVIEVNHQSLLVPREYVQIRPVRPQLWSVVPLPADAFDVPLEWGSRYAVCPNCSERAPLGADLQRMPCPRCQQVFAISWSDAEWA